MEKNVMEYDNLILGAFPTYLREIEIADNAEIKRGDLLLKNESGKYEKIKQSDEATLSDSNVLKIAADNLDSTDENRTIMGYVTGEFRKSKIGVGEGFNIDKHIDLLDKKFIFVK